MDRQRCSGASLRLRPVRRHIARSSCRRPIARLQRRAIGPHQPDLSLRQRLPDIQPHPDAFQRAGQLESVWRWRAQCLCVLRGRSGQSFRSKRSPERARNRGNDAGCDRLAPGYRDRRFGDCSGRVDRGGMGRGLGDGYRGGNFRPCRRLDCYCQWSGLSLQSQNRRCPGLGVVERRHGGCVCQWAASILDCARQTSERHRPHRHAIRRAGYRTG